MRPDLRESVLIKVVFVGIVIVILLVPIWMIRSLVSERQGRRDTAALEVGEKWGGLQTVAGPFITIPYRVYWIDEDKVQRTGRAYAQFLPDDMNISVEVFPEIRSRGIFNVVVYRASFRIHGNFSPLGLKQMKLPMDEIIWDEVYLSLAISDMRGIRGGVDFRWNGMQRPFEPGIIDPEIFTSGIHAVLPQFEGFIDSENRFELQLDLNGSEELYLIPAGKLNRTTVTSTWPDPSFVGAYLPAEHEIGKEGFKASWEISYLSRSYPVKYAILFILLTFVAFFLFEIINKLRIHPFQYLLVGLAMSVFYLLLLSVSEHLQFTYTYVLAAAVTIGIIGGYAARILQQKRRSVIFALLLVLLYVCLFILLQLEDYALLLGSIIVFLVLGFVMYITRNIDWYSFKLDRSQKRDT
jgi:inner membrane protein